MSEERELMTIRSSMALIVQFSAWLKKSVSIYGILNLLSKDY
ncbi:hypothetical protein Mpsy_2396 [Methanolobus psychrophilus R15]|nr:hypothetical protein Mpsy_2396 [Methanolobus psychrophilus R15]